MTHPQDETNIVEVYSAANGVEAGAVRAALDAAGINARIVGEYLGSGTGGALGLHDDPRIWVRAEDAARAREVILQLQDQMGDEYDDPNPRAEGYDEADGAGSGEPGDV